MSYFNFIILPLYPNLFSICLGKHCFTTGLSGLFVVSTCLWVCRPSSPSVLVVGCLLFKLVFEGGSVSIETVFCIRGKVNH